MVQLTKNVRLIQLKYSFSGLDQKKFYEIDPRSIEDRTVSQNMLIIIASGGSAEEGLSTTDCEIEGSNLTSHCLTPGE
jgi:hypothetical protein